MRCASSNIIETARERSNKSRYIIQYITTRSNFLGARPLARPKGRATVRVVAWIPARTRTPQIRLDDQRVSLSLGNRARDEDLSMRNKPVASATLTAAEATKNPIAP
jgi:hypothetical protein